MEKEGSKRININIQEWANGAYHVVEVLLKANMQSVLEENFQIERSPDVYIEIIRSLALENLDKEVIKYFAPSEPEEIIHAIIENVKQRKITEGWAKAINYMIVIGPNWPWESFIQEIDTFTRNTAITFKEWKEVLEALWYIKQLQEMEQTVNTVLEKISKDGRVFHYLYESFNNNDWETVAWNLMTIVIWNPQLQRSNWNRANYGVNTATQLLNNPNDYEEILDIFTQLVREFSSFKDLLVIYSNNPNIRTWIGMVFENILSESTDFFFAKDIINNYHEFKSLPENLQKEILSKTLDSVIKEIVETGFKFDYMDLYFQILRISSNLPSNFEKFLKDGLRKIDKDQWHESLKEQNTLFQLLQILISKDMRNLNLKHPLSDALINWVEFLIDAYESNEVELNDELIEKYAKLPYVLEKDSALITFWKNLRDYLIDASEQDLSPALLIFGEGLISSGVLSENADKITRKVFRNIIEWKIDTEIKWMIDVLKNDGKFIENIKTPTLKDFLDRLKGLSELPEDLQEQIKDVENRIELELKKRGETSD